MLDDARALDSLLAALRDQSWEVRQAAAEALGQRQSRIAGTGWWGRVRRIAGKMLGQRPDPRVVEALRNTLRDQSPSVRSAAASALQEYRDPESVPLLLAMLHDPDVQTESVLTALGRAGDDRAIEPLIALAEDIVARDPNIERVTHPARVQVLNALRRITGTDLGRDPADWRKWWEAEQAKTP
jgi:HEAT repeat protein